MIAISVASCKKDKTDDSVTPPVATGSAIIAGTKSCVLTKLSYDGGDYETIEYDTQNKPVKDNFYSNGVADGYMKIIYTGNDISQEYYNKSNVKTDTYTFKLGSNGYISTATNSYTYTNSGFNYTDTDNNTLTYSVDGYLAKIVATTITTSNKPGYVTQTSTNTTTYTYTNGNRVSGQQTGGSGTYNTVYEYYTDKPNNLPNTDDEILTFLLGKRSTNLIKKEVVTSGTSPVFTANYTYAFNADGLISKQTTVSGTNTYNQLFEYSCK